MSLVTQATYVVGGDVCVVYNLYGRPIFTTRPYSNQVAQISLINPIFELSDGHSAEQYQSRVRQFKTHLFRLKNCGFHCIEGIDTCSCSGLSIGNICLS